jgi:peptide/nickel transport system permease protein
MSQHVLRSLFSAGLFGSPLVQYIGRRLLIMIPTFVGIVVISFLVIKLAPGDPGLLKHGNVGQTSAGINAERGTEDALKKFRQKYGFDKPLHYQFGLFVHRIFWERKPISFRDEKVIWPDLWRHAKVTLALNVIVFALIYIVAIPLGIFSAAKPRSRIDTVTTVILFMLYSLPSFWAAELLRSQFGHAGAVVRLPISELESMGADRLPPWERFVDLVKHCILPITCMTYGGLAFMSRYMRAGMLEVIRQDYIRTAEAKGAGPWRVVFVHALRNGLFPVITLFASLLPFLISGSVIIESVFSIPGMGLYAYNAVNEREYDIVMTTLLLSAILTLFGILASDIMYVLVNPQVSFDSKK